MRRNMFSRLAMTMIVAGSLFMVSCDKEDSVNNPNQPGAQKLTEYKEGDEFVRFEYNTDGTVKKLTLFEDPISSDENVSYTVTYDANKKPVELTGNNGSVIKTSYVGGKLAKTELFFGTEKITRTDYTYDGNVLKTIQGFSFDENTPIPFFKSEVITNAAGNVTRSNAFLFNPFELELAPAGHVIMQYDNKVNPLASLNDFLLIFWQVSSKNNIVKEEHFDEDGAPQEVIERTYTYNDKGLPIRVTVKERIGGGAPVESTATYTYQ